jgi:hypothetical protein
VVGVDELDFSEEALAAVSPPQPPASQAAPEPIELPEVELEEEEIQLAPMHTFVPPAAEVGHKPEPVPAPEPRPTSAQRMPAVIQGGSGVVAGGATPADGGEALLREALSRASREVIEKIAWEVVPVLAEAIIREQVDRLVRERQAP